MSSIDLPHGTVNYRVAGPADATARPVVFAHAFLVNAGVWSPVADLLAKRGIRSYAPDWPLGAHTVPLRPDADQSPRGVARQMLAFLEAMDLRDVTLVGSDTGGALCQFAIDTDPDRIGSLVLANCDAFDTFPPFPFSAFFALLQGDRRMRALLQPMKWRPFRHSPMGFGLLANDLDPEQTRQWVEPCLSDPEIRGEAIRFLKATDPKELLDVSNRLSDFDGPVRIVWGAADRAFPLELGRRLARAFADAEFVEVPAAKTFVQLDAPEVLADQIAVAAWRASRSDTSQT